MVGLILQEKRAGAWAGGDQEGEMKPGPPHGAWWVGGAVFLNYCALCSSCVSPGGTGGQKLAQLPELASAEISLHAIYLHQVSGWRERPWVKCRVRGGLERKDLPGRSWRRRFGHSPH